MTNKEHLYIEQSVAVNSPYTLLQQHTLSEIQRLSGRTWTNYNAHDPGITTGDIANYILTELDYKLGFEWIDYLTREHNRFVPEEYGMFLPERVYPTTPVTLQDYRKLFFLHFPDLENVKIELTKNGGYRIRAVPSPFCIKGKGVDEWKKDMKDCFNANRNLCEKLDEIEIEMAPTKLYLHSELEIEPGENASSILAQIYWKIFSYLSGGVCWEDMEQLSPHDLVWEDWLEGPFGKKRITFSRQENTMAELYEQLLEIKGIKTFKTLYLSRSKDRVTDVESEFTEKYSLFIPEGNDKFTIKIRIGDSEATIDPNHFKKELDALYFMNRHFKIDQKESDPDMSRRFIPAGTFRSVYGHRSMGKEFPAYYRAYIEYFSKTGSDASQTKHTQFGAYLKLFDLLIHRGLKELKEIKNLLSIRSQTSVLSGIEVLPSEEQSGLNESDYTKNVFAIKNQYMDWLDHLYGVDSNPQWAMELCEGKTEDEYIEKRMAFLREVPYLTQTRSRAYNVDKGVSTGNIPTIKKHLSLLLDLNPDEGEKDDGTNKNKVYVLEQHFFVPPKPSVLFVFCDYIVNNTDRFKSICRQLVSSLLPAHLKAEICWLKPELSQPFKIAYNKWCQALANGKVPENEQKEIQKIIDQGEK